MNDLAVVDVVTGEILASHDARALTTPTEGVEFVRLFDRAVAMAKASGQDRATVNQYAEQLVRHVRETGRLIAALPRGSGPGRGRPKTSESDFRSFLSTAGLGDRTARNWQSLHDRITDTTFDETIEHIKADDEELISLSAFYALVKKTRRAEKEAKREASRSENRTLIQSVPSIDHVRGAFSTIMIDPPWDWGDEGDADQLGRARPQYATMSFDEIRAMPIGEKAAADSHIYLWITNRSLPKGFELLTAWGFRYVTCITWGKPSYGMGNYFRGQTEQVLFGVRGSLPLKRKDVGTLFLAPRGPRGHSSKPAEFYDLIESCSPGPYLEMFARSNRKDWTAWGAEANAT